MTPKFYFQVSNFMGVLNARFKEEKFKLSAIQTAMNFMKIIILIFTRKFLYVNFNKKVSSVFLQFTYTQFFRQLTKIHRIMPMVHASIAIAIQLIWRRENIILLNQFINFRLKFCETFPRAKKSFKSFKKSCVSRLTLVIAISSLCFIVDYCSISSISLTSLLAYIGIIAPDLINMNFICYFFIIIQFIVYSHDAMIESLSEIGEQTNAKRVIQNIAELQTSLFASKQYLLRVLSLQIINILIYFIVEIINQVRQ